MKISDINSDYALYLPAVGGSIVNAWGRTLEERKSTALTGVSSSLKYVSEINPLHTLARSPYPYTLYSAGGAVLDARRGQTAERALHDRDRDKTFVVADSGGYQVKERTGEIGAIDFSDMEKAETMLADILSWIERTADASMSFDIPPGVLGAKRPHPNYETFEDCLTDTKHALRFFEENRTKGGNVAILNVLHGRNYDEAQQWYDAVKSFPFEGWAFGGGLTGDYNMLLRSILTLIRDGRITQGSHLHFLGRSFAEFACLLTHIMRRVRDKTGTDVTFTFDTSNASRSVGVTRQFASGIKSTPRDPFCVEERKLCDVFPMDVTMSNDMANFLSKTPWPAGSPVLYGLSVPDILVPLKDGNGWDWLSDAIIYAHNLHQRVLAIKRAQVFMDDFRMGSQECVCQRWAVALNIEVDPLRKWSKRMLHLSEIVDRIFDAQDPSVEAKRHWSALAA